MSITVVLDKKAQIFIRGLSRRIRTDVPKQGQKMGTIVRDSIQRFAPKRSGALSRSFDVKVRTAGGSVNVTISSDLPYANIQNVGGRAGRNLSVTIRGTRYIDRAVAKSLPQLQKLTTRTLATIVRASARR